MERMCEYMIKVKIQLHRIADCYKESKRKCVGSVCVCECVEDYAFFHPTTQKIELRLKKKQDFEKVIF